MATKPDCHYYDWGDTAPREYGAFCKKTRKPLRENTCEKCNVYQTVRGKKGCEFAED